LPSNAAGEITSEPLSKQGYTTFVLLRNRPEKNTTNAILGLGLACFDQWLPEREQSRCEKSSLDWGFEA